MLEARFLLRFPTAISLSLSIVFFLPRSGMEEVSGAPSTFADVIADTEILALRFPLQPMILPWDVLLLVFVASSPSTLAVLAQVSLDFLIATSPLLYGSVEVKTLEGLGGLFCGRKDPRTKVSSTAFFFQPIYHTLQLQ